MVYYYFTNYHNIKRINLLSHKSLIFLNGKINKKLIDKAIIKLSSSPSIKNVQILIDSQGGYLLEGIRLIVEMQLLKNNGTIFECYAITASSTAFDIFEFCDKRYVIKDTVLMQHNTKIKTEFTFDEFEHYYLNYFHFSKKLDNMLNKNVAKKIGITLKEYFIKISKEWKIEGGGNILKEKLADEIVILKNLEYVY